MRVQRISLRTTNIYDFLVDLYEMIDDNKMPEYVHQYQLMLDGEPGDEYIETNMLLDEILEGKIEFSFFLDKLNYILNTNNYKTLCVHILRYFDRVFKDKDKYPTLKFAAKGENKYLYSAGPLNTRQSKYKLYLMPEVSVIEQGVAMEKIRPRVYDNDNKRDVFGTITSYKIIGTASDEPEVVAKYYDFEDFCKKDRVRIAIVPVSAKRWFEVKFVDCANNYFEIEQSKSFVMKEQNESYGILLEQLMEEDVEIVIFPELAMNRETENYLGEFLAKMRFTNPDSSIKLVFAGSLWKSGINECVLFSGSGKVLIRNTKKEPFEIERDGKTYTENLLERPARYETLDVRGLGRILYLICKDSLESLGQAVFWDKYNVNFEVISSYSPSISFFEQSLEGLVQRKKGIAIVANCCEPRKKNNDIVNVGKRKCTCVGFVGTTAMRRESPFRTNMAKDEYYMEIGGCKMCQFCGCVHIAEIHLNVIEEREDVRKVKVEMVKKYV